MIDRLELAAWLRLLETPGVGRDSARRLLAVFGSPQATISASVAARSEVVGSKLAQSLCAAPAGLDSLIDLTVAWLQDEKDAARTFIPLGDPHYPRPLLDTCDPPLVLYAQGCLALLEQDKAIAIVGSRNPTPQGEQTAHQFAKSLAQASWVVVSGLALGIDAAAHEGALDCGSPTIAVVGTGLDRVYPRRHLELAHRIASQGLLLSEFALGTPALAAHFPLRNRIIAGITKGTLVVEAALQSGSLITARLATEAGRDVFAIPGSIHSPQSRGCHLLIKQGAKLVETAQEILEELHPLTAPRHAAPDAGVQSPPKDPLLEAMGYELVSMDALVARTGWSAQEINIKLLALELEGQVARRPGQLFQQIAVV